MNCFRVCYLIILLFLFQNSAFSQLQEFSDDLAQQNILLRVDDYVEFQKSQTDHLWRQVDTLIYIDSIFNLDNRGMDNITVELNGYRFRLTIDPREIELGDNIFLMPEYGILIFNIGKYINPDPELTVIRLNYQGQAGDSADILIGDVVLPGEEVDFVLELKELPKQFMVSQNYPNPFNQVTNILISLPDDWLFGAEVNVTVYNLLGQKVKTLFRGRRFYGDFTVTWDGSNEHGVRVSSGVYLYQIRARDQQTVKKMFLIK